MGKQKYDSYLKFLILVSFIFIGILLIFFRREIIINTSTMTKDFYNEYMSRDTQKHAMILLGLSYFMIFMLYSVSLLGILDKIYRYGFKDCTFVNDVIPKQKNKYPIC